MMALLMGVRTPEGLARACDLGVAMQLSNIARDVGEDARMGRLYLPQAWLVEAGIAPDARLAAPVFSPALGAVVRRLLDAADALYRRVDAGVARLPLACRPGINAARFLYAEIGHEVARSGFAQGLAAAAGADATGIGHRHASGAAARGEPVSRRGGAGLDAGVHNGHRAGETAAPQHRRARCLDRRTVRAAGPGRRDGHVAQRDLTQAGMSLPGRQGPRRGPLSWTLGEFTAVRSTEVA